MFRRESRAAGHALVAKFKVLRPLHAHMIVIERNPRQRRERGQILVQRFAARASFGRRNRFRLGGQIGRLRSIAVTEPDEALRTQIVGARERAHIIEPFKERERIPC